MFTSARYKRVVVVLAAALALFVASTATRARAETPSGLPSLEQLIDGADSVLFGTVTAVSTEVTAEKAGGSETKVLSRVAKFQSARLFSKQRTQQLKDFEVRQELSSALGAHEGDTVLWFLARSESGSDYVLGGHAGYFKVDTDGHHQWALSLAHNKGLWGDQLWTLTLSREPVAEKLRKTASSRVDEILKYGDEKCQQRGIPIELVLAAIDLKLRS